MPPFMLLKPPSNELVALTAEPEKVMRCNMVHLNVDPVAAAMVAFAVVDMTASEWAESAPPKVNWFVIANVPL